MIFIKNIKKNLMSQKIEFTKNNFDMKKKEEFKSKKIKANKNIEISTFKFMKQKYLLIILYISFFIVFIPLFQSVYSQRQLKLSRKLSSNSIIKIKIFGKGKQRVLSEKSEIKPSFIKGNGQTLIYAKEINLNNNIESEFNITIEFNFLELFGIETFKISLKSLFQDMTNLLSVDLTKFDYSKITDTSSMFQNCINLKSIILGNFDTSMVLNMRYMFSNCSVTSLDLSKFKTSSVKNMEYMFSNTKNLKYLDLKNFETFSVTNMAGMFSGTQSLIYLNLFSFKENSRPNISNIFSNTNDNLIYCLIENNAQNIALELRSKNLTNNCSFEIIDNNEETTPEIITDKKSNEKNISEIMGNCSIENYFKGVCGTSNQTITNENKDMIINEIVDKIISGDLKSLLSDVTENNEDFVIKEDDVIFQITTTNNQNNKEYNNISNIELGECEDKLKRIYNISKNESLIILKIDYFMPGLLIPVIGYEVFHPENKSKLDLSYCENFLINYNIPVSIDENNIDKYDPNSDYYNDECSIYTTEDGTDIILNDRKIEYNENNLSLCENNCTFTEYDINTKKSICMCEIKSKIYSISEIIQNKETISNNFNIASDSTSSSVNTMKCFNTLFSKYGLLKNLGNYILLVITILFIGSGILFYKIGYNLIDNDMKQIMKNKENDLHKNSNKDNIYQSEKKTVIKVKRKKKKKKTNKKGIDFKSNPIKKNTKNSANNIDSIYLSRDVISHKSLSGNDFKSQMKEKYHRTSSLNDNPNKISETPKYINGLFSEFELNSLPYKEALLYDKRKMFHYYMFLNKIKHPLLFSFYPIEDYNVWIIKIDIFLLLFSIMYAMNALFITEKTIHRIYADKGEYIISNYMSNIICSFIISHFINILIKFIFLSERNILELKCQKTYRKASEIIDKIRRCIIIKYIFFYILGIIFLIIFWYYLSSFCAVYQNTQIFLIINTFICFGISLILPFLINLIPSLMRNLALRNPNKEYLYRISQYIQII